MINAVLRPMLKYYRKCSNTQKKILKLMLFLFLFQIALGWGDWVWLATHTVGMLGAFYVGYRISCI